MPVNLFVGCGSIQRVIILNGEIKGLQSSSVIQLSVTWLISRRRRGDGPGRASQRERGERKVNVNDGLDSTRHPNYSEFLFPFPSLVLINFEESNGGANFRDGIPIMETVQQKYARYLVCFRQSGNKSDKNLQFKMEFSHRLRSPVCNIGMDQLFVQHNVHIKL